jgi:hypothetical protein
MKSQATSFPCIGCWCVDCSSRSLHSTLKVIHLINQRQTRKRPPVFAAKSSGEHLSDIAKGARMGTGHCVALRKEKGLKRRQAHHSLLVQQTIHRDYAENTVKVKVALFRCAAERQLMKIQRNIDKRTSLSCKVRQQIGVDLSHITEDDRGGPPLCDHVNWIQSAHKINEARSSLIVKSKKSGGKTAVPARRRINSDRRTRCGLERIPCAHPTSRVRQRLAQTLMHKLWSETDGTPEWRFHSRRQLKYGGDKWCAEFSNNRRPVSTTWPWSIRPSLAVIWGVCWMFYPQQGESDGHQRHQHQHQQLSQLPQQHQQPQQQQRRQEQRHQFGWQAGFGFGESVLTGENLQRLSPGTYRIANAHLSRKRKLTFFGESWQRSQPEQFGGWKHHHHRLRAAPRIGANVSPRGTGPE